MADYIAVYDLEEMNPSPYGEFIDQASMKGWTPWIWGPKNGKFLRLPNTTLIGEFSNSAAAKNAFDEAVSATTAELGRKVVVEKFVLGSFTATSFYSDDKMDP